jgi:fumarate reductase subunit D
MTAVESKLKTAPPIWWRFLFWASIAAMMTSVVTAIVSILLSLGFGLIALFAGSTEGFSRFSLSKSQVAYLFFASAVLCLVLIVVRRFTLKRATSASRTNRVLTALTGIGAGFAVIVALAARWVLTG